MKSNIRIHEDKEKLYKNKVIIHFHNQKLNLNYSLSK